MLLTEMNLEKLFLPFFFILSVMEFLILRNHWYFQYFILYQPQTFLAVTYNENQISFAKIRRGIL